MFLGTVDDWTAEGTVVSWYPTQASHAGAAEAAPHPAPVSYQQSQHLQYYRRQTSLGRDIPRLCIGVWEIMGICDIEAMTEAVNAHVRRHDTYHDRFAFGENDEIHRYVIADPETITLAPTDHGLMTPPQIRKLLLDTPDPLQWDCFTFGIIQGEDRFTVYIAIDHLRADGMSAGVIFLDIQTTYFTTLESGTAELAPRCSHRDYCTNQRAYTASLDEDRPDPVLASLSRGERTGSCPSSRWIGRGDGRIRRAPSTFRPHRRGTRDGGSNRPAARPEHAVQWRGVRLRCLAEHR